MTTRSTLLRVVAALVIFCCVTIEARAGDILRGGSAASPTSGASRGGSVNAESQALPSAHDSLARTSQALAAVKAMQTAARAAAISRPNNLGLDPNHAGRPLPNIPNGLAIGGLQVAPKVPIDLAKPTATEDPTLWQRAKLPTQSTAATGLTTVNIQQTEQQALLNWQTFNLGKNTTLNFDQSAGGADQSQWIAFNKINDPSGVPSQILGSLNAAGQVYVLNSNGIIFGGSSQVNTHALVAAALPLNDNLLVRGLLNNPDDQFLFSALDIPILPNGGTMPAFKAPPTANTPTRRDGDVTVQAGASLTSPTTADHVGGRVALIGPNVTNAGTISTPDGQTILAGGNQVGLVAHASTDPSLRGLDVFVGAVDPFSGTTTNSGFIDAPRANVTLAGKTVNQLGAIDSSTSVSLNGRIDLLANYNTVTAVVLGKPHFNPSASGIVTLGAGSVTRIVPEFASMEKVVGTQLALGSQINLQGLAIHLGTDTALFAPNANATLNAGSWIASPNGFDFVLDQGQVYLDFGALIDVSGSRDVSVPVTENIIDVQLRGAELANSPLQRNGPFRGQTIHVDIRQTGTFNGQPWIGTPLADTSGYVGLIQRSVGELTTAGGSVKINAGGSVVLQPGSGIDVSGGSVAYQSGLIQTTKVLADGRLLDISQATPDRVYDGIYNGFTETHPKFGLSDTSTNAMLAGARFEPGYVQGANAGAITIAAPAMALDGRLLGQTIVGPRQRTTAPNLAALSLAFQAQQPVAPLFALYSPTPPNIVFQSGVSLAPADPFALDQADHPRPLRADRTVQVVLAPELVSGSGFGNFKLDNGDGNVAIPGGVTLATAARGSLTFSAANLDIEGKVNAANGSLAFNVFGFSPLGFVTLSSTPGSLTPPVDPTRGHFTLGATGSLQATGLVVDDRASSPNALALPLAVNGGSVAIKTYSANLVPGSVIDASGGVVVNGAGKASYGKGGSLTIQAGQDPNIPSLLGGQLSLNAALTAFGGGNNGGSLSLLAPLVQVGGTAKGGTLLLDPEFFSAGGFGNFKISGLGAATDRPNEYIPGVVISPGTLVAPVAQSLFTPDPAGAAPITLTLTHTLLPPALRPPVSLTFNAPGVIDSFLNNVLIVRGDLVMGAGSSIQTDPRASVGLTGNTAAILGSVFAPGGTITISGGKKSGNLFTNSSRALPTVDLGPGSTLSTAGATLLTPNGFGFRAGSVLDGGSINLTGNIVAEAGARLDVSGASDVLDVAPGVAGFSLTNEPNAAPVIATRVESSAGSISFQGSEEFFTDATLIGRAGGSSANGGTLALSSGRFVPPGTGNPTTPLDATIVVTQAGPTIPAPHFYVQGQTAIGHPVVTKQGQVLAGLGHFAADDFNTSGFDSLSLNGTVQFSGPVTLVANANLNVATGGVIIADAAVNLRAPHVALGGAFLPPTQPQQQLAPFTVASQPFYFPPTHGPGAVNVAASLIDVGNLSLQNVGDVNFVATNGDIRGDGTLDVAGNIALTAGQIYPPSAVAFNVAASDFSANGAARFGTVAIAASGSRQLPLSAGGQLNIFGSVINQGGVLRAPIGSINLGGDVTSAPTNDPITNLPFAAAKQLTLAAGSVVSVAAIDPATSQALTIPYGINLNGTAYIDPTGADITAGGVPTKSVNISAASVADQSGSSIDIRGGGDLYAFRFVPGIGGTRDILGSASSFAVLPNYAADYAPFAPFNPNPNNDNLGGNKGYVNTGLAVGDRVSIGASPGLAAGNYTLLPARYALLPGAILVTPQADAPAGSVARPDGSTLVAGYRFNDLNAARIGQPLLSSFEVAPAAVVRSRAQYDDFSANTFLKQGALSHDAAVPRLPVDSGQLVLAVTRALRVDGSVTSQAPAGGRGGLVDISSPTDIFIAGPGALPISDALFLQSSALSAFGAESLLIGGTRKIGPDGTAITVATGNLTINNAGAPLTGPDIILVAKKTLTVFRGADIESSGAISNSADTLLLGDAKIAGSGDGTLLRVTSDPGAKIARSGVDSTTSAKVLVGGNARIAGGSVTLDSTSASAVNPNAILSGISVVLDSGQISLQLANPASLQATAGLVLSGRALQTLQTGAQSLSLLSYSSIDLYGTGQIGSDAFANLALHAAEIRGFNGGDGTVTFAAQNILLDNGAGGAAPGAITATRGTLAFDAGTIQLGANQLRIDQFADVALRGSGGIIGNASGGLTSQGNVRVTTPLLTGATGVGQAIAADGALTIQASAGSARVVGGLGAAFTFFGSSVTENAAIVLPSGTVTLRATGAAPGSDVIVGGNLDVGGTARTFFDLTKFTDGGTVSFTADRGNVQLTKNAVVSVAAQTGGGVGGKVSVSAANGRFSDAGTMLAGGTTGGVFTLDTRSLPRTGALDAALNAGAFNESRTVRVRVGDVAIDGVAAAHNYSLSADGGAISVSGQIDALGNVGGSIALYANGGVTLASGSSLTVAALAFDAAGKGGAIDLETRGANGGQVALEAGSTVNLSVGIGAGGTLHLRAPQTPSGTDLAIVPLAGKIINPVQIIAEGYKIFDASSDGSIDNQESAVAASSATFGNSGPAVAARVAGSNAAVFHVRPGAEIVNTKGDLVLSNDWDLSTLRYGQRKPVASDGKTPVLAGVEPGLLTLRAAGSIVLNGAISDGFGDSAGNLPSDTNGNPALWKAPLLPAFQDGTSQQSWSYRLAAGADFKAADTLRVTPILSLPAKSGSLLIGQNGGANIAGEGGRDAHTDDAVAGHYQVIRTGTGDIEISAGRDVRLLNQFATIYTAGTQVADPTMSGKFDLPRLDATGGEESLGAIQEDPAYLAQYSFAGGNVAVRAQADIIHLTQNGDGVLIPDSERQFPINWLYRRGYVDTATSQFGKAKFGDVASTSWWVDFSNYFEGVGALGGGNVTLNAGHDVSNVDAVVPTNARAPKGTPDAAKLVELGGGDLTVRAGHDLDGGVYYVERGQGSLAAGNSIHTNSTRSPSLTIITDEAPFPEQTWLPTSLFLGKGSFNVSARGDLTLGPVANPFLLPEGYSNTFWYKTYFSTYAASVAVNASSLTGTLTLRESATLPGTGIGGSTPLLQAWLQNVFLLPPNTQPVSFYQPWLRLDETSVNPFGTLVSLMPGTLRATAFSGDLNMVGRILLSPSPQGTVDLAAAKSLNGLQPEGVVTLNGVATKSYGATSINISDANPAAVPGSSSPFAYQSVAGTTQSVVQTTSSFLLFVDALFRESGSTEGAQGVLQTKQALHDPVLLHANDAEPLHLYAGAGDISGLTLFSPKASRINAGRDITDIAFYVQDLAGGDVSLVATGRDLVAYDPSSPLRAAAQSPGSVLALGANAQAGDLQISGPGTLEVLASRNLDLGIGPNNADGTGVGISSIGNARNPALPFSGAQIVAGAGLGATSGLAHSQLDFTSFVAKFLDPQTAPVNAARYLPDLAQTLGLKNAIDAQVLAAFNDLPAERRDQAALDIFYLVLRDAGRDHAKPDRAGFRNYNAGFAAIAALFPAGPTSGDISLTSREIKTASGGDINLFAPGGQLTVGFDVAGNQAVDQGILTEDGGNISIFTRNNVVVGTSRIFTLRGGNEIIFSSTGNIAAGASSKTVQSAPPTRVLIDPQSGDVKTDLAGLATGGGIGVLDTVAGVPPGDVDLIAPAGTIDAGDAGIRVSGNLNIAALTVLNAGNIQVGGASVGTPVVTAPNLGGLTAASNTTGAATNTAAEATKQASNQPAAQELPSIITVEVIGYGGGAGDDNQDPDDPRRKKGG